MYIETILIELYKGSANIMQQYLISPVLLRPKKILVSCGATYIKLIVARKSLQRAAHCPRHETPLGNQGNVPAKHVSDGCGSHTEGFNQPR